MGRLIFITGGARSGKSAFAVRTAKDINAGKAAFVATCVPEDDEMKRRVALHKKNRPSSWRTIEAGWDLLKGLRTIGPEIEVTIIDCLTLFISGLLMRGQKANEIKRQVKAVARFLSKAPYTTIMVSNEVGAGIVPDNRLSREFRDAAGIANQFIAKAADEVYFVVSGIPVKIKNVEALGDGEVKKHNSED